MKREWKPGDVAIGRQADWTGRVFCTSGWVDEDGEIPGSDHGAPLSDLRPLVVIDPEDREQVERLAALLVTLQGEREHAAIWTTDLQDALREFATPPKPEVLRHFIVEGRGGLKTAHCGKVWRVNAEANVTVLGDCPDCAAHVKAGWSA